MENIDTRFKSIVRSYYLHIPEHIEKELVLGEIYDFRNKCVNSEMIDPDVAVFIWWYTLRMAWSKTNTRYTLPKSLSEYEFEVTRHRNFNSEQKRFLTSEIIGVLERLTPEAELLKLLKDYFETLPETPATPQGVEVESAEVVNEKTKHPKTVKKEQDYYNYTDYYIKLRKCVNPNYNQNKAIEKTLENFNIGERTLGRALEANTEILDKFGQQKSISKKYPYVKY